MYIPSVADCRGALALSWKGSTPPTTDAELKALDQSICVVRIAVKILYAFALITLTACAFSLAAVALPKALIWGVITIITSIAIIHLNKRIAKSEADSQQMRQIVLTTKTSKLKELAAEDWGRGIPGDDNTKKDYDKLVDIVALVKECSEFVPAQDAIKTIRERCEVYFASLMNGHYPMDEVKFLCLYQENFGFKHKGISESPFTLKFDNGSVKFPAYAKLMLAYRSPYFQKLFFLDMKDKNETVIAIPGVDVNAFKQMVNFKVEELPSKSTDYYYDLSSVKFEQTDLKDLYNLLLTADRLQFGHAVQKLKEQILKVLNIYPNTRNTFNQLFERWKELGCTGADMHFKEVIEDILNAYIHSLPMNKKLEWEELVGAMKEAGVKTLHVPDWVTDDDLSLIEGMRLERLGVNSDKVTDAGLVHMRGITTIRVLDLSNTKTTDAGLENCAEMQLLVLKLNSTQVTGPGFQHLKKTLTFLSASHGRIVDASFVYLVGHPLEALYLNFCPQINGSSFIHFHGMPLRVLELMKTQVVDQYIADLIPLPIGKLSLNETRVTDDACPHLGQMSHLVSVDLTGCHVSEHARNQLKEDFLPRELNIYRNYPFS